MPLSSTCMTHVQVFPVMAAPREQPSRLPPVCPLTAVTYKGRAAWIGVQLGEALEYKPGAALCEQLRDEWADEFTEGLDFDLLRGAELAEFKKLVADAVDTGQNPVSNLGKTNRELMLIYESGLWKALMLTKKPAGKRLRKWLGETVMPEIAATGGFISGATPAQAEDRRWEAERA